jgi:hypothetical protein
MAAPTNAACVKKSRANPEPSTHDPRPTLPWQDRLYNRGHKARIRSVIFPAQSAGWSKRQYLDRCRPPLQSGSVIEIYWVFCFDGLIRRDEVSCGGFAQ